MVVASLEGILGATATVIVTTLEDCVWLVPFVVQAPTATTAWIHVVTFLFTFEALAVGVSLFAVFVNDISGGGDLLLGVIGAVICWSLSILFFVRSLRKNRNRRRQEQQSREHKSDEASDSKYGSISVRSDPEDFQAVEEKQSEDDIETLMQQSDLPRPWLIVTLTVLGSLDEVAYFPALILADIFTPADLCIATLLASLIILLVLCFFLAPCQPFLDLLDRIPLYGIVGIFAILLTLEVIWEALLD